MAADILLSFGVATSDADVSEIQKGLQTIIKKIERDPPQVRVGLTVDDDALKGFKTKLEGVLKTLSLANGAPITLKIDGLGEVTSEAAKATRALGVVSGAAKKAGENAGSAFNDAKKAIDEYFKALANVDKRLGHDISFDAGAGKWVSATREFQYLADALTEAEQRFHVFASAEARASMTADQQEAIIRAETDAYHKYGITVEDAVAKARAAADKSANQAAVKAESAALAEATLAVKNYYSLMTKLKTGDYKIAFDGKTFSSAVAGNEEFVASLNRALDAYKKAKAGASSLVPENQERLLRSVTDAINDYNLSVEEKVNKDRRAAAAAKAKSDANRARADEIERARNEVRAYNEAASAIKKYFAAIATLRNAKPDITFDGAGDGQWFKSELGDYRNLADELNRTKAAYNAVNDAMQSMPSEHQAKLQALIAEKINEHNLALEALNNKERIAAETSRENARSRAEAKDAAKTEAAAFADATRAVKEYYAALTRLAKQKTDISLDGSEYKSASGNYAELAKELNRTKTAFDAIEKARTSMGSEYQIRLQTQMAQEATKYNRILEEQANKERIAAEAAKARADAEQAKASASREKADAAEEARKEAGAFADATRAVKEYYAVLTKLAKQKTDIFLDGSEYRSASGNYAELAKELNRTKTAFDAVEKARNTLNSEHQAQLQALITQETAKYNRILEEQANKERIAAEAAETAYSQIQKLNTLIGKNSANLRKWTAAKDGDTASNYSGIQSTIEEWKHMRSQIANTGEALTDFDARIERTTAEVAKHSTVIKDANKDVQSLGDRFGSLAGKFASWLTVSQTIMFVFRTLKKMVATVVELDSAMTELKKVTNETDAAYERFLTNASKRARELGASLSDVVSATADFARLGHSVDVASKLADAALIYKNVGDGVEDITQASESIVSTMQAFQIDPNNVMHIVDVFNSIGNKFAISSGGVGDALQRSSAAMYSASNTLEETAALIAAANTVLQNPDSVGTTLKTVSMFLRASKVELEEAGESTEGMANSVSELQEKLLALTEGKVNILTEAGNYKSTYQILKEIAEVWDHIVETQGTDSAAILELLGGKRNANAVAAILENFEIAEEALSVAMNSAGSALRENEIYLDSITGKISKFQSSWETLSSKVVNGDLVKGVVDLGTVLLDALNWIMNLVEEFNLLHISISVATAAIIKFGLAKNILSGLRESVKNLAGGAK